jgi:hypothetical protein
MYARHEGIRNMTKLLMRVSMASVFALFLAIALLSDAHAASDVTLSIKGRDSANVSMAADDAFVVAVWSASPPGGSADIFSAVSVDGGVTFGTPVRVNATVGDVSVNGEQPPRVALSARAAMRPVISVIWTAKGANGTRLLTARSTDGGRTFTAATAVAGSEAAGSRGWESIAYGPGGYLLAAWLDHRQLAKPQEAAMATEHRHDAAGAVSTASPMDGVAMAQLSQLYVSAIDVPQSVRAVTGGVCYCCKTAIATSGQSIYLAWRHVYPGNMRDIAFSASRDGGQTFSAPVRISEDQWQIDGCPDDGPSMGVDASGRIHVVWPTLVQESGRPVKALFHAVSVDGRTFHPRTRIPTQGQANHPQLATTADGRLVVVWDESGSGTRHLAVASATIDRAGSVTFARDETWSSRQATYPYVVRAGARLLMAWTEGAGSGSVVRVARYQ